MYLVLHVQYQLFLSDFNNTWNSLLVFKQKVQISNFMKMYRVESELFYADRNRRTDRYDETDSRLSQLFEHT
jgi:hypothetical protein